MDKLIGKVSKGKGGASKNFKNVENKIAAIFGCENLCSGTLNIELDILFSAIDDGVYECSIDRTEYNQKENVKIKRCRINGIKCVIVRPDDHFQVGTFKQRIEIMCPLNLRQTLMLKDDDKVNVEIQGDDRWWNEPEHIRSNIAN